MKKTSTGLLIVTMLINFTAVSALAAGATSWDCVTNKVGLKATFESSMFGETLTTEQTKKNHPAISITYFVNEDATPPPGSKFLLQDDPAQGEMQKLKGSYASELAEIQLTTAQQRKYDFGFLFQGNVFLCLSN